jgi:hypothetical protein
LKPFFCITSSIHLVSSGSDSCSLKRGITIVISTINYLSSASEVTEANGSPSFFKMPEVISDIMKPINV